MGGKNGGRGFEMWKGYGVGTMGVSTSHRGGVGKYRGEEKKVPRVWWGWPRLQKEAEKKRAPRKLTGVWSEKKRGGV